MVNGARQVTLNTAVEFEDAAKSSVLTSYNIWVLALDSPTYASISSNVESGAMGGSGVRTPPPKIDIPANICGLVRGSVLRSIEGFPRRPGGVDCDVAILTSNTVNCEKSTASCLRFKVGGNLGWVVARRAKM
jgi:hypothetical protein